MRLPRRGPLPAMLAVLTGLSVLLPAGPAAAVTPDSAPAVTLLAAEGTLGVDCGALPAGAGYFEVLYQPADRPAQSAKLPDGASSTTITVQLDLTYAISCRSRFTGYWSPRTASTWTRYPDLTLPVLRVDTTNAAPIETRETYVGAQISVNPNGSAVPAMASTSARLRGRGNSTWTAPTDKKPYKLRLDKAASLLGMPAYRDWALLATYFDRTMLRQSLAYSWGAATSLAWTPRTRFVELVLNGDYRGVYQVSETVDVAPSRVNIDKMSATDTTGDALTGGYLGEIDYKPQTGEGQPGDVTHFWGTYSGTPVTIKDPDPPSADQVSYLRSQFDAAEVDIFRAFYGDTAAWSRVQQDLDLTSFADWYIVSELSRNHDAWYSSTYFFKPRNGKLTMGPLWDFDQSMGTFQFGSEPTDDAWVRSHSPWFRYLLRIPEFKALVVSRYAQLRPTLAAYDETLSSLDAEIRTARTNDEIRWGYAEDLPGELSNLRSWLAARQQWFDTTYG